MKTFKQELIEKAKLAKRESKYIEFKETFNIDSGQDWCEIVKDIVAIANTGGGILIFGAKSDGTLTDFDYSDVLKIDPATITDKVFKYTNSIFQDFEIAEINKAKIKFPCIIISEVRIPMVFCKPGTYPIDGGKQKNAFAQGTIYYRHGAKSEPCTPEDLKNTIERNLEQIKKSWLGNIRKVVSAPQGAKVTIISPNNIMENGFTEIPIRITNDEKAPAYKVEDPNITHPHRAMDIINAIKNKTNITLNSYHLKCIKKEYNIEHSRPDFFYKPKYGSSPQYSPQFLNWLLKLYHEDNLFFDKIRAKYLKESAKTTV